MKLQCLNTANKVTPNTIVKSLDCVTKTNVKQVKHKTTPKVMVHENAPLLLHNRSAMLYCSNSVLDHVDRSVNSSTQPCIDVLGKSQTVTKKRDKQHSRERKMVPCNPTTSAKSLLTLQNHGLEGNKNRTGLSIGNSF